MDAKERELRNVVEGDDNTAEDLKIKSINQGEANDALNAESSSHSDGVATAESRIMITSGDPQSSKRMDATEFSEEHGPPRKVHKVKRSIASPADILRRASRVPSPRTSAELKDKFLSHCSQISAGAHTQIIGDPIGAVEVKVLTSQTHTYKLCRV